MAPARRRWARRAAHPRGQAGNLPRELTTFIGRQHQVEQVSLALGTAGLVTLVGPGGVGKTRLALRIAAALKANYAHGAWLAELAPVTDAHGVVAAVADALAVRERPGQDLLTSLRMALQPRQMLLVLDNCEHVLQSCAELVTALLRTCDSLSILATSRRPLGVSGEVVSPVGPLPIASTHEPIDTMIECDAVQLLAAGIEAAQPGFALDPSSAVLAGEICHLVDGLPLGIELAASRARTMTLTEIATGLSDPLRLLTLGPSTAPTRQQT
ncbi:MAG: AAA family ATPase, partial [Chloroflexi bacterium]|nr:AAA family ATPase [Chloroflexota bacterium]